MSQALYQSPGPPAAINQSYICFITSRRNHAFAVPSKIRQRPVGQKAPGGRTWSRGWPAGNLDGCNHGGPGLRHFKWPGGAEVADNEKTKESTASERVSAWAELRKW